MYQNIKMSLKCIYKTKQDADGNVQKHKTRMVPIGFTQQPGIGINEMFAPVSCMDTIRTVLAISAQNKWPFIKWMLNQYF